MLTRRHLLTGAALLALSGWAALNPVFAQSADPGAGAFIQKLGTEAINSFANKSQPKPAALAKFKQLLNEGFDVPYIGRWVLGRYWNQASPQQQQEYQQLFEQLIVKTYAERFVEYSGETFKITGTRPEGESDTMVTTQIIRPAGPPVAVDWRVRKRDAGYKIIDVVVEGVSMGVTQRQEFASVIQSNGGKIDGLIQALRQKTAQQPG
ncbi:MAG TPA: ABC transporter substrate-binding protein [Azospirillum sp.]|nr:ABC transporter substrate-binding protein [Azospirillum sp.]